MIRILALMTVLFAVHAAAAGAAVNADYDNRNGVSLGDTPAYSSAADFVATVDYDSAAFGEAEEYSAGGNQFAACAAKGARSGWVRFNTAVDGQLFVSVDSSTAPYDVFYSVYTAPNSITPGSATIGQMVSTDCQNAVQGAPGESYPQGYKITGGNVIYVQTLSVCADRVTAQVCSSEERIAAKGGPTRISLRFDPDDSTDEDGVPKPLDKCPDVDGVVGGLPSNGCPDADKDGVTEPGDQCENDPGHDTNGCRKRDDDGDGEEDKQRFNGKDCDDNNPAIKSTAEEIPGNLVDEDCDGETFLDKDRDKHDDQDPLKDCRPANPAIHSDAREIPGNRVDENCDETEAPFPALQNIITPHPLINGRGRALGFDYFDVADVKPGMSILLTCRGRDCPLGGRKTFKPEQAKKTYEFAEQFKYLNKKRKKLRLLQPGVKVTVLLTQPGYVGRGFQFVIPKKGGLIKRELCIEEGLNKGKPAGTCTGFS